MKNYFHISVRLLTAFVCLLLVRQVGAAVYFVNSNGGNDNYNGAAPAFTSGVTGPWQTLGRLAGVPLQPNDTVYLACGAVWNETLKVPSSGANGVAITIAAGPGNCVSPPTIDGAVTLQAHQWVQHIGSIYKTKLPIDLIANSNPGVNLSGWSSWATNGDSTITNDSACPGQSIPCMAFTSGTSASVAISNSFPISGGVEYTVGVQMRAPIGTRIRVALRRDGPSYEALAPDQWVTAAGVWQSVGFIFRGRQSVAKARLDVEVPGSRLRINVREAHVRRSGPGNTVLATFVDGLQVRRAHHPNFGQLGDVSSPYAAMASAGAKTIVDTTGLPLPAGASLTAGLGVTMRSMNWAIEERRVASVIGRRLSLDLPSDYSLDSGKGYFLTGALWMLDSPGEWFYDSTDSTLYVWMPDGALPGDRVAISSLPMGVDATGKANLNLRNIDVRRVATGVGMAWSRSVSLGGVGIYDVFDYGINAIDCSQCLVQASSVTRSGLDAIIAPGSLAVNFTVVDSTISYSAFSDRKDGWRTLPRPAKAAVQVLGASPSVLRNTIIGTANLGVNVGVNATVADNYISRTCMMVNDCGAIYANYRGNAATITGNIIETVVGNLTGLPGSPQAQTVGIYLDDHNADSIVSDNVVTGAEYGIQLHNARLAKVSRNVLVGNRRHQLWLQEHTGNIRSAGDVFGNSVTSNLMVPTAGGPALYLVSEFGDTGDFATFDSNHYSALLTARVIGERSPIVGRSYTVPDWQAAYRELSPRITQAVGYASFLTGSVNLIANGDLSAGKSGWTSWNPVAPNATATVLSCSRTPCMQIIAGGSPSLLSSPNFSVVAKKWYRVTFDAITSNEGQPINALVLRGGGGSVGYEYLIPAAESFVGSTSWRRYSFTFQALKTINAGDPVTMERGARIDFERNLPGTSLTVARLELVELTPAQASQRIELLLNRNRSSTSIACEALAVPLATCSSFVYVSDGSPVQWPVALGPLSARPIYTRDVSLTDRDLDGIADQQDGCPGTEVGKQVNARGCSIDQ